MAIYNFLHTPVYEIGDKVYCVSTRNKEKFLDCPDCLGKKEWKTTSPAGIDYSFDCPRCTAGHIHDKYKLSYYEITYTIVIRTIGSIRIDTNDKKKPITYMCEETGVGSGSVYDEKDLFGSEAAAKLRGEQLVVEANKHHPEKLSTYGNRLSLSRYHLHLIPEGDIL